MVLAAGGTGFAPIWAIACAALTENWQRPLVIVAGSRTVSSLYMAAPMELMSRCPNVDARLTCEEEQTITPLIGTGTPNEFVPQLQPTDIVYAAGAPRMVDAVGDAARTAGALFYADPFEPVGRSDAAPIAERFRAHFSRVAAAAPSWIRMT